MITLRILHAALYFSFFAALTLITPNILALEISETSSSESKDAIDAIQLEASNFEGTMTSYLCLMEATTGFRFDRASKKWIAAEFASEEKFIVRRPIPSDEVGSTTKWIVKGFDSESWPIECGGLSALGTIFCPGVFQSAEFNPKMLRLIYLSPTGYTSTKGYEVEGNLTPHVSIGSCTEIG